VRLFVAVSLPEHVVELVRGIDRPDVRGLRWTTEQQWHVTLRFLGQVEAAEPVEEALGLVPDALASAGGTDVRAVLGPRVAWFPGRQVLYVPVSGLDSLAQAVGDATAPWGQRAEDRPFSGHLTLARARGRARPPARLAGAALGAQWRVEAFVLMSSVLGRGGAHYERLATVALTASSSGPGNR
jgi:2'-5' RNA ligase